MATNGEGEGEGEGFRHLSPSSQDRLDGARGKEVGTINGSFGGYFRKRLFWILTSLTYPEYLHTL